MNATGAVVFLPREGNGPSLMLEELLFDPAALWLAESLRAAGVERFFVVCHTDDQARAAASFPAGTEFVTGGSGDAVEQLSAFLNALEGKVIVITKADLADTDALAELYRKAGFTVLVTCGRTGEGAEAVKEALAGKVSAFCGNSGAGKSSLLNAIDPRLGLDTGDISQKLGRGRHTTRHVELYQLENGGFVADTPGFSAVELDGMGESNKTGLNRNKGRSAEQVIRKEQLADCFREFAPFAGQCRFSGCSHTKEAGCAVLEAVRQGQIAPSRHQSYLSLYEQAKAIKDWQLKGK